MIPLLFLTVTLHEHQYSLHYTTTHNLNTIASSNNSIKITKGDTPISLHTIDHIEREVKEGQDGEILLRISHPSFRLSLAYLVLSAFRLGSIYTYCDM